MEGKFAVCVCVGEERERGGEGSLSPLLGREYVAVVCVVCVCVCVRERERGRLVLAPYLWKGICSSLCVCV